ncbi:EAL and HDOD domain-containing protein [Mitsuaria sp. 7]|uniref:EAL and HDOD domain-containing protein n=1 Tax=Mitsuaria sp. 7 TaxID=1658665 RepID=UPI0009ED911F|nr:EAL domain-containing protein [Mitsuaria sp. 7]
MSRSSEPGHTPVSGVDLSPIPPSPPSPLPLCDQADWQAEHLGSHLRYAMQPVIDRAGRVVATELLFRWNASDDGVGPELGAYATAAALSGALIDGELLIDAPAAEHPIGDLLVNMDRRTLMSPIAEALTPDVGVIELLETVVVDAPLMRRIQDLHGRGYRFALDDIVRADDARWALAPWVQFAKIDVVGLDAEQLPALVRQAHGLGLAVIAEKIEDDEAFQRARRAGADYFQGYGIARPTTQAVPALPGCDANVVGQLFLLARSGVSASSLALIAGRHPALVARLLRVQAIHAPHGAATAESLTDVLMALPRAVLVAWLAVFNIAAVHGRDRDLARLLRGELAEGRLRLRREGLGSTSGALERASFVLCKQLLRMRLLSRPAAAFSSIFGPGKSARGGTSGGGLAMAAA